MFMEKPTSTQPLALPKVTLSIQVAYLRLIINKSHMTVVLTLSILALLVTAIKSVVNTLLAAIWLIYYCIDALEWLA